MPTYDGTNNNDTRSIGWGKNLKWTMYGKGGHDTLTGGNKADKIYGGTGNDSLNGRGGNDILNGGTGADTMTGGDGHDTYYVDNLGDKTVERISDSGIDKVYASVSGYRLSQNVEKLFLTNGVAHGYGNSQDNEVTGNGSNRGTDTFVYQLFRDG